MVQACTAATRDCLREWQATSTGIGAGSEADIHDRKGRIQGFAGERGDVRQKGWTGGYARRMAGIGQTTSTDAAMAKAHFNRCGQGECQGQGFAGRRGDVSCRVYGDRCVLRACMGWSERVVMAPVVGVVALAVRMGWSERRGL